MIDLHTHILPGIDDGSPNAGTSMRMLRQMAVQGTQILCASPHYYADEQSIHEFCEKRDVAFAEVRQAGLGEYEDQPIVCLLYTSPGGTRRDVAEIRGEGGGSPLWCGGALVPV